MATTSSIPSPLRIALAQIAPALGNLDRNRELHRRAIGEALEQNANLIVFPELSLTGYYLRDMVPEIAMPADAEPIAELAQLAGNAALVLGFVEQSPRQRFFNSALFAHQGQTLHVHRKVYLPTYGLFDEQRYFAAGNRIRAFDAPGLGRVGLVVCEDFWHLSVATILQAEEIDVLICISNSPARGVGNETFDTSATYERVCRAYAQLLGVLVVLVNRVGFEDGLCFWGGSMVAGPDGAIIAQAPMLDESLTVAEVDLAELRRARIVTPLARDERLLLTIEELQRIKRREYEM